MDTPEIMQEKSAAVAPQPTFLRPKYVRLKLILGFLLAWGFLNVLLNVRYPLPEKQLLTLMRISPEVLFLVGALCVAARLRVKLHWSIFVCLTTLVLFFRFFNFADELVPMYFFRPFNLYIDSQFVPVLIHLLYKTMPLRTFITWSLSGLLLLAAAAAKHYFGQSQ